jgi:hypothetical protein
MNTCCPLCCTFLRTIHGACSTLSFAAEMALVLPGILQGAPQEPRARADRSQAKSRNERICWRSYLAAQNRYMRTIEVWGCRTLYRVLVGACFEGKRSVLTFLGSNRHLLQLSPLAKLCSFMHSCQHATNAGCITLKFPLCHSIDRATLTQDAPKNFANQWFFGSSFSG